MSRHIRIKLGNQVFDTIKEASESLGLKSSSGLKKAVKEGKTEFHKLPIQVITRKKASKGKKFCPVICTNLNKKFNTITDAAKFAGVNDWTMSVKMQTAGQFEDKNGNIYVRLKPMNSCNNYINTGTKLKRKVNKMKKQKELDLFNYNQTNKVEQKVEIKTTTVNEIDKEKIAKEVLKEKMKEILNTDNMEQLKNIIQVYEMM